ncbi:hypothetical protein ACVWYJ_005808 [Bradyrhizobium sp. USDA 4471]
MFSDHLRLNLVGIEVEMLCQMHAEAQAVEEGAGAQHAIMPRADARDIGERIGRIGHDQDDRVWRRPHDAGNDFAIDPAVGMKQPQPALGVAAVGGPAGLFVDAGGDHHQLRIGEVIVIPIDNRALGTKRNSVTKVGRHRLCAIAGSVHDHDRPGATAHDRRESTGRSNFSCADYSDLHD